jgi:prevent-host-death family protein
MSENIRHAEMEDCADFIDRAAREKERIRVVREGEEVAAVIPIEDLDFLERIEDHLDYLEAREALEEAEREGGLIPWEEVKAKLGLL